MAEPGPDQAAGTTANSQETSDPVSDAIGVRSPRAAAVDHLFDQFAPAAIINLVLVGLVLTALWGHAPIVMLVSWSGLIVAVTALRAMLHKGYRSTAQPEPAPWIRRYLLLTGASGLLWGLSVPLFVPLVPDTHVLVLVIAIAGLAAGSLPINAAVLPVYLVYLAASLGPVAVTFFLLGDRVELVIGGMTLLYALSLTIAGAGFARMIHNLHETGTRLHQANRQLELRASHDGLTALWNRSRFESALDEEFSRCDRYGQPCTLIMLDIDHFKQVNDSWGHDAGDHVLQQLSDILRGGIRQPDRAARWGGEEFMVLLPETALEEGRHIAERLRRQVEEHHFGSPGHLTISLGVAEYASQEPRSTLLKRLDDALYRAKQNGRNRLELATCSD